MPPGAQPAGPAGWTGPGDPPPIVGGEHGLPPKPLWRRPWVWAIAVVVLVALGGVAALAGGGKSDFAVDEPESPVHTEALTITGKAPNGSIVTLAGSTPAVRALPETDGTWAMPVPLEVGTNSLTFEVNRDGYDSITVEVEYFPNLCCAPPSPSASADAPTEAPTDVPTAAPTDAPTDAPTEAPTPAPTAAAGGIDDGTWVVGEDIQPGTYRLREAVSFCYWARLKGFGGDLGDIVANETVIGWGVVTIAKSDKGFQTAGCGTWTRDLSQVTASKTVIEEGTLIVGMDLRPGTYRASGGDSCYWARLKNFGGTLNGIIANGLTTSRAVVTIRKDDKGFKSTGCGTWVRR
jgi:hypothetical protein